VTHPAIPNDFIHVSVVPHIDKKEKRLPTMRYLLPLTLGLILLACTKQTDQEKIDRFLIGNWTFDSLEFKDQKIFQPMSNILSFKENHELEISGIGHCSWSVETTKKGRFFVVLNATNPEFRDSLRLKFRTDNINKLLKMNIESENLEMDCSRLLLNYDSNRKEIENVINLTKEE
jgi:hypothetical protein